jgi:hypothetical protein
VSGDDHGHTDEARIITATRGEGSVTLGLSCGHAVLRRPGYVIPRSMTTDCDVCAAERGRARREAQS